MGSHRKLLPLLLLLPLVAAAQLPADDARSSLAEERRQIEQRYQQAARDCGDRFLVTPCQNAAKAERRQALAAVRAKELQLDDAERARRAELRRAAIQEKQQLAAERAASGPVIRTRAPRPPLMASAPAASPTPATEPKPIDGGASAAAQRAQQSAARQREIQQRQAAIAERQKEQQERAKPHPKAAAPLPAPASAPAR